MKAYPKATEKIRKTDVLFILPEGPKKGQAAAKSTISRWIKQLIIQAYGLKRLPPPLSLKAHSTRAMGASWAAHHQISMAQVCKAVFCPHVYKILPVGRKKEY